MASRLAAVAALIGAAVAPATAQEEASRKDTRLALEPYVFGDGAWDFTSSQVEEAFANVGFQWLDAAKTRARLPGYRLKFDDRDVAEVSFRFTEGRLSGTLVVVYSRGDSGSLSEDRFDWLVDRVATLIGEKSGLEGDAEDRSSKSAARAYERKWEPEEDGETAYRMQWSSREERGGRGFIAEFVKLTALPYVRKSLLEEIEAREVTPVAKDSLRDRVERVDNGDVWIPNVPMVDQGDKGYCAVATVDRVMRYYGIPADQHEMAQIADASAWGGTDPEVMVDALKKITGRLRVRTRAHEEWDYDGFIRDLKGYTREARRHNRDLPDGQEPVWTIDVDDRDFIYYSYGCYPRMDGEVFKAYRTKQNGYGRFRDDVIEHVDEGIPILWGCQLGMFKEPDIPQMGGGHMRLIIGYNKETDEIIFSDTWGIEHAAKRLGWPEAYTMTTGYYTMEPTR